MKDTVSVVIPTYNRSDLASRAVRSVLAATSPGDEVLVIDDGSTDDTPAVMQQFGDAVRYVRIDNSGPGAARNAGIRMARCPLVTFLDSDDVWVPDKLTLQRNVLAAFPSIVFCFGNMFSTLASGEIQHDLLSDWRSHARIGSEWAPRLTELLGPGTAYSSLAPLPGGRQDFNIHIGNIYGAVMQAHCVHSDAVLVRRELAGDALRYPEDIRVMDDYECFARLSKVGAAAYLDCELADLRPDAQDRVTDVENVKHLAIRIMVLERVWGADAAFQATHSNAYQRLLASKVALTARLLITSGRLEEARELLRRHGGPASYRLIASLPPTLVNLAARARRKIRSLVR